MNRKKKILFVGESSFISSGFGTYHKEILNRLVATNKYEIAELACYGLVNDPRDKNVTWRYYANAVKHEDPRFAEYNKHPTNIFGYWRFDRVLMDFKPDIVIDIRDPWMLMYEKHSAFRKFFHLCWMPTCDSAPQRSEWIDAFIDADSVFTYNDWALEVLRENGNGKINLIGSAPPAADPDCFFPIEDKAANRIKFGVQPDIYIVGTVMRNQKRKLFPDLFKAFRLFLEKCKKENNEELAKKTYLYCHTSYPDMGWDIPDLIKEHGLGNKILFTYVCKECKSIFVSFFQDAKTICPFCNCNSAVLPNVGQGVPTEALGSIMNMFDLYVQYAMAAGFEMPIVEAASCGVPIASIDYSAPEAILRKLNGYAVKVKKLFRELETGAYRAYPDNNNCADIIYDFLMLSDQQKELKSKRIYQSVQKHYTWDKTSKILERHFDSIEHTGFQGQWDTAPEDHFEPNLKIPDNLSNESFINWLYIHVLNDTDNINSFTALSMIKELNYGVRIEGRNITPIERKQFVERCVNIRKNINICEAVRCGKEPLDNQDFLEYAKMKEDLR